MSNVKHFPAAYNFGPVDAERLVYGFRGNVIDKVVPGTANVVMWPAKPRTEPMVRADVVVALDAARLAYYREPLVWQTRIRVFVMRTSARWSVL
jgi:hypothetical protein